MASSSNPASTKGKRKKFGAGAGGGKRPKYGVVDITRGLRGFLITCDQGKEQPCQREVLSWLSEYADRLYPPTSSDPDLDPLDPDAPTPTPAPAPAPAPLSVGSALQAELRELQQQRRNPTSSKERFAAIDTGVRGIVFVHSRSASLDHPALLYRMLDDVLTTHRLHTRYTIRIHPLLRTCFSRLEDLTAVLHPLLQQHMPALGAGEGKTFAVVMNKRSANESLQRAEVIEAVVSRVGAGWTVDLDEPDTVVLVEVATRMAGVGILQRWKQLHKFNVRALAESAGKGVEEQKDGSAAAAPEPKVSAKKTKGAGGFKETKAEKAVQKPIVEETDGGGEET